jgi:replicative DNA helicase
MESGVPLQQLRAARLEINDWYKLAFGVKELQDAAIYIDDTAGLSVAEFRARAREMKRRENIQCVIVDYLQLMEYKGLDNRVQEISGISRTLKQVGRELGIPVIALSQLSRDVEKREDKRPMLSDLRESGSIEQDADMVVFLYRDAYYRRGENTGEDVTEVIVAKHRNGPVGTVTLRFNKTIGRFVDHGELVTA